MAYNIFFLNCSLKTSDETSNTQALIDKVWSLYEERGATCTCERLADYLVHPGVTADAGEGDEWPGILEQIKRCDVFVLATPIWMGVRGSLAQLAIERLDGSASNTNALGQPPFINKVAGCIVTGNEDGAHAAAGTTLYNLTHLGFSVPALADCYWVGPAGPGPSYIEARGDKHLYTNRTARYLVHSTLHLASLLADQPYTYDINALDQEAKSVSAT